MIWEGECMTGAVVVGRQANRGFIFPQAATRCWQSREPAVWIAPSHTYAGTDRHPESQIDRETYCQTFRLDVRAETRPCWEHRHLLLQTNSKMNIHVHCTFIKMFRLLHRFCDTVSDRHRQTM